MMCIDCANEDNESVKNFKDVHVSLCDHCEHHQVKMNKRCLRCGANKEDNEQRGFCMNCQAKLDKDNKAEDITADWYKATCNTCNIDVCTNCLHNAMSGIYKVTCKNCRRNAQRTGNLNQPTPATGSNAPNASTNSGGGVSSTAQAGTLNRISQAAVQQASQTSTAGQKETPTNQPVASDPATHNNKRRKLRI